MARKNTSKSGGKKKGNLVSSETIKKIWSAKPARAWLAIFEEISPENKWSLQGANLIKGCCPYHPDKTPSFHINFNLKFAKCFGCGRLRVDLVDIVRKLKGTSYTEALLFLQKHLGLDEQLGDNAGKFAEYNRYQEMKKGTATAFKKLLAEFIRDNPKHLQYMKPAYLHLTVARKLNPDNFESMPIGIYGKPEHVKQHLDSIHHDLYDEYWSECRGDNFWGALVFHYNDTPGTISKFKLRFLNKEVVKATEEKFPGLDGVPEGITRTLVSSNNFRFISDKFVTESGVTGVFGLHEYRRYLGSESDTNVYVTEGEFDVLSIMNAQADNNSPDFIIVGTSGKGELRVGFLKDLGVRNVWLVPDHPTKSGDSYASAFLKLKDNYVAPGSAVPFNIKIYNWPNMILGNDLDDAVRSNGYEILRDSLLLNRNHTFSNSNVWVTNKCDEALKTLRNNMERKLSELEGVDPQAVNTTIASSPEEVEKVVEQVSDTNTNKAVQIQNIKDDYRNAAHATILEWFAHLHSPTERHSFAQKYISQEGIDITQDSRVYSAVYALDTREGVIKKIKDSFKEHFTFAYYEKKGAHNVMFAWSKEREELVAIPAGADAKLYSAISQYIGQEFTGWIESLIKASPFWEFQGENLMSEEARKTQVAAGWIRTVLDDTRGECPNMHTLTEVGQGIHHFGLSHITKANGYIYFVNGNKVFRGMFNRETDVLEWNQLDNCVDNDTLFKLDPSKKWSFVEAASDLYAPGNMDLKETYYKIKTILDGWLFEDHEMTSSYLAAQIMAMPITAAIGNVNLLYVTGERESGKTSLIKGLMGGTKNNQYDIQPILESASFQSDMTPASMYQAFDKSSLAMIYDEAEVSENHNTDHDRRTQEIQRIIMPLPQGGVTVARGGQTADQATNYYLRMPVVMAGINVPTDGTLLSRMFLVYTKKEFGRKNLSNYIAEHFSEEEIMQLRQNITVGLLPHIPELIRKRVALKKRLSTQDGVRVPDRFLDTILTPLLVFEFVGAGNAEDLFRVIYEKNKDRLGAIYGAAAKSDLINECLYNATIRTSNDDYMTDTVNARSLIIQGKIDTLNNAAAGVYYLPEKDWIVLVWRIAKHQVLKHSPFARHSEEALRERVSKVKYLVPEISAEDHTLIQTELDLADIKNSMGYSVIEGEYLGNFDATQAIAREKKKEAEAKQKGDPSADVKIEDDLLGGMDDLLADNEDVLNVDDFDLTL